MTNAEQWLALLEAAKQAETWAEREKALNELYDLHRSWGKSIFGEGL